MPPLPRPLVLRGDAFTSPARTPWGGSRLVKHFGKRVASSASERIGESWEFSLGPELPSRAIDGALFADVVADDPEAWLGTGGARAGGLLVKLLDADEPLSLQIHPPDDHPLLGPDESGKPEAWYVAHAEPSAWIAFGWREGVERVDVLAALARADGSLAQLVQRVPVQVGDCFVVDAGTPHAIGPGVTLVEPQYVARGKRGVTYRYWDWDRRYDTAGRLDPSGAPRALHVDEALGVTDWEACGAALLARAFRRAGAPQLDGELGFELLAGLPSAPNLGAPEFIPSEWLRVVRVAGSGIAPFFHGETLHALTVLGGTGALLDRRRQRLLELHAGDTIAIPACHEDLWLEGARLHAIRTSIEP